MDGEGGERHIAGTLMEGDDEQRTCRVSQGGDSGLNQALPQSIPRRGRECGGWAPRDFRSTKRRKSSGWEGGYVLDWGRKCFIWAARMGRMTCHIVGSQGPEITFLGTVGLCRKQQEWVAVTAVARLVVSLPIWLQGHFQGHGKRELGDESLRSSQWDL